MATAQQCDCCKRLFSNDDWYINRDYNFLKLQLYNSYNNCIRNKEFDLCPDCMGKIIKILEGKDGD